MSKNLRISLAMLNDKGAVASLTDSRNADSIDIIKHRSKRNVKIICVEAAEQLRKLADAFERLSESDEPWKEKTQAKLSI